MTGLRRLGKRVVFELEEDLFLVFHLMIAGRFRWRPPKAKPPLANWTARVRVEAGDVFPEKVTAFRPGMAVHGRQGQPCPDCGASVQRIVYAANESNYCAVCQAGGRLLADRALSRLMREDWPRTLDELEAQRASRFSR